MLASLALQRTYDGNPQGLGVGQTPPPTLDRFTDTLAEQAFRTNSSPGAPESMRRLGAYLARDIEDITALTQKAGIKSN